MALRLGTRGSALARWQAEWIAAQLTAAGREVQLVPIATQGDADQRAAIGEISSSPGVFTKELQRALLDGRIDLAVHSLKDLPTLPVPGLVLAAVPPREVVADVLIARGGATLEALPAGARVGTGSMRRRAQLLSYRADLQPVDIRGNVDTRIAKLRAGDYEAIVLALAGLTRLGLAGEATQILPTTLLLPAVGQGALGLETRADDSATRAAVAAIDDPPSHAAVTAERALLARLLGGCLAPIGAWARLEDQHLRLSAVVLDAGGQHRLDADGRLAPGESPIHLGVRIADALLAQGAAALIAGARQG